MARAFAVLTETNPFPATLGRICPHPCETGCNRKSHDGAVAINALERFLGDWGLAMRLSLPMIATDLRPESIGVVGGGPAGLSFAYQMARRGYRVTVYEKQAHPGGMLFHGIPEFRLPAAILDAEIARLSDMSVEIRLNSRVGVSPTIEQVRIDHDIVFLGIGAGRGRALGIPGEEGPGRFTGAEFLEQLNRGEALSVSGPVVVVGGGNTAIDAARSARRAGAPVTILYRRTRDEMPAIPSEVEDALAEGVHVEFLAVPVEVLRDGGRILAVKVQRMQLGAHDATGRRSSVAVPGSTYELPCAAIIAAVSQAADTEGLPLLEAGAGPSAADCAFPMAERVWAGGDLRRAGIAAAAIAQGRRAAEAVHAQMLGQAVPELQAVATASIDVKPDHYAFMPRAEAEHRPPAARLAQPDLEVEATISRAAFLREVSRCLSCGKCFGCEHCYMFCNASVFTRKPNPAPGAYFELNTQACEGCRKCVELCPSGFLTPSGATVGDMALLARALQAEVQMSAVDKGTKR